MAKAVKVTQKEGEEVPVEVLAESIVAIAQGVRKLRSGRLNDRALFLLVQHAAPMAGGYKRSQPSIGEIEAVFAGIDALERTFIRKQAEAKK